MEESTEDRRQPDDAALDGVPLVVLDRSGATVAASRFVAEMAGEDALDDVLDALVHPDDAVDVARTFVDVVEGVATTGRVAFRRRSAPDRLLELTLFDFLGTPAVGGVVGVVTEVDGREPDLRTRSDLGALVARLSRANSRVDLARELLRWGTRVAGTAFHCYLYDGDAGELLAVDLPGREPDDRPPGSDPRLRKVYRTGRPELLGDEGDDVRAVAVPMGDHGVLVARSTAGGDAARVGPRETALLGGLLGLALDRVGFATAARLAAEAERATGEDLDRVRSLARTVRRAEECTIEAESATAVHECLCRELVRSDVFAFAWVGEIDFQAGKLVPKTTAGEGRPYVESVDLDLRAEEPPPAVAAAAARERRHERAIGGGLATTPWRREALASGFQSVLAVPIGDPDDLVGVLAVYTRDPDGFDEESRRAVAHLGALAGYAIETLAHRDAFFGATSIEVKLRVPAPETALGRLAGAIDGQLEVLSVIPGRGEAVRLVFTAEGPPEETLEVAREVPGVGPVDYHADRAEVPVFEATCSKGSLLAAVTAHGGILTAVSGDDTGLWLTVTLGQDVDVRNYVESVRVEFPGTEIAARRVREDAMEPGRRFRADYAAELSDRQREVFEAAYFGGYFGWPRSRTGSEIADSLDISQPTFSRHLRAAQRKLGALLFERSTGTD